MMMAVTQATAAAQTVRRILQSTFLSADTRSRGGDGGNNTWEVANADGGGWWWFPGARRATENRSAAPRRGACCGSSHDKYYGTVAVLRYQSLETVGGVLSSSHSGSVV
jgi:hypothetical protein